MKMKLLQFWRRASAAFIFHAKRSERSFFIAALTAATTTAQAHGLGELEGDTQTVTVTGHYNNQLGVNQAASEGTVTSKLIANRATLRPAEVLEFVPGVIVTQHSGEGKATQYFLRGFNLDHGTDFATFVDGMPVNMVSHAHGQGYSDLNFLIPELIRRIDYKKGPYAAREGDFASAGSARIGLVNSLDTSIARLTLGQDQQVRGMLASSQKIGGGQLLGAIELQGQDGPWTVPMNHRKANGVLRYTHNSEGVSTSLTAMAYKARWTATDQIPQRAVDAGTLGRFDSLDASDGGDARRLSLSGHWQRLGDLKQDPSAATWRASFYAVDSALNLWSNFTYLLDDPVNGDQFEQAERRRMLGGELATVWPLTAWGAEHQVTAGLQVRADRLSPVGLYRTVQRARTGTTREDRVNQMQTGAFAELFTDWAPWLRSTVGLRADHADFKVRDTQSGNRAKASDDLLSPKLSVALGPWAQTEFFANWGEGFHSNDARGTVDPADPMPGLVKSRGFEIGARAQAVKGLQSSLALWRLNFDSELVYIGDAGNTEASRASKRYGIEWHNHWVLGQFDKSLDGWLIDLDLATSRARFTEPAAEGQRVPGAVGRVASFGLTYDGTGPWFGQFQARHFGPRDLSEDGTQRSDATTLASARLGWRITPDVTVTADVFNLFNNNANGIDYFYTSRLAGEPAAGVDDRHFHPVEPRTVRVTVGLKF
jgi:TonB dependent receptor/TonB-dependent Receptor Plug Domain